ncbi:MAG: peptidase-C39 like family protein [Ignavibacteria bacterium RBG_13_36_8]|nr:MAG: peptidase-C39 like family protein [Ignavibacteria bacterium RBG_13_36_8]
MIPLKIQNQPNDVTCGPTSLHAVYSYYGDNITLEQVISEVRYLSGGGTLNVMLANHALKRGYKTKIYTYNLKVFDPTWFNNADADLTKKLKEQLKFKKGKKLEDASKAYVKYLKLGGEILFEDLTPNLLSKYFDKKIPILTGLSATYLYNCSREHTTNKNITLYDNVKGFVTGHFVVLCCFNENNEVIVADPYKENPVSNDNYYSVDTARLINSIMLGIVTYDSNLLIIQPKD